MVKRFVSVILAVTMVCCMVTAVGAIDGTFDSQYSSNGSSWSILSTAYSGALPWSGVTTSVSTSDYLRFYWFYNTSKDVTFTSSVGLYLSFYPLGDTHVTNITPVGNPYSSDAYTVFHWDTNSNTKVYSGSPDIVTFEPAGSTVYQDTGITMSVKYDFSEFEPGYWVGVEKRVLSDGSTTDCWFFEGYGPSGPRRYFKITSARIVAVESSEQLAALENIANEISAGNDLARAMYGDIMAALNAVKDDTALIAAYMKDALTTLNEIKVYNEGIYNLCNTYLKYLAQIAASTDSIDAELKAYHQDFMEMMETLNSTVIQESDDIQAKMEEIYNLLIAYLDTQYSSAVNPDLIESTGNAQLDIDRQEELEVGFQSNLTESWTDLQLESFSLGGGYTSAVAWVSSWFSNFYNAMGDYGMILLLPLYIGIVTLVAGLARQAIRRSGRADRSRGGKKDA